MLKIKNKIFSKSCCGKEVITLFLDTTLLKEHIASFVALNFTEKKHFTEAGIFYVDNEQLIITGPFGSNRLEVKCRTSLCREKIIELENNLNNLNNLNAL